MKCAALFVFAALVPLLGRAAQPDVIRLGAGSITTNVASLNGIFPKYGIEIRKTPSLPSQQMRGLLADGTLDIVDDGLDNAVASVLDGVDIVIVTGSALSEQQLIGQPQFNSVGELRGKTLIVDALDTQYALILKKILLANGLKPNLDYRLQSGSTRRLPDLQAHPEYAAGMMAGTSAILAKRLGFIGLATSSKTIGPFLASGSYVRRQWARDHAELLSRYIAANIEAQRWILDPANKTRMIDIIMATSEPKVPVDIAQEAYVEMTSGPGALTQDLSFDVTAFETFLRVRAEVAGSWNGSPPPAATFYDLSYYKDALSKVRR